MSLIVMALNAHIVVMLACSTAMLVMQRFAWSRVGCMGIALDVDGTGNLHTGAST